MLERYYADVCCSDELEYYRFVDDGEQAPWLHRPHPSPLSQARSRWWRSGSLPGQSAADELRTASKPCCAGSGDDAGGFAVVGLDPDAGLIAACCRFPQLTPPP